MRISFIGTSHGVPEPDRKCTSSMIEVNGYYYFIDMGCPAIDFIMNRGINIDNVKGIFFTHPHSDHMDGFFSFASITGWYFKNSDPTVFFPNEEVRKCVISYLEAVHASPKKDSFSVISEGVCYEDENIKVTAIGTMHCTDSRAFFVEAEGKRVLFTGDLAHPSRDFPRIDALDLAVCEAAHFPITDYESVIREIGVKRVYINHFAPRHTQSFFDLKEALHDIPVVLTNDGMEINI